MQELLRHYGNFMYDNNMFEIYFKKLLSSNVLQIMIRNESMNFDTKYPGLYRDEFYQELSKNTK